MAGDVATYRVLQDERFFYLRIGDRDYDDWKRKFLMFEEASRGMVLGNGHWNDDWEFVRMDEGEDQSRRLGDFATMTGLIAAINKRGFDLFTSLMGEAAEVLGGSCEGREIWAFNVLKRIDRREIGRLDTRAVFRVHPVHANVFCLTGFKDAVEGSGLKGLRFIEVDPNDRFGMV